MNEAEFDGPAIQSILTAKAELRYGREHARELKDDIEQTATQLARLLAESLSIDDEA
jgi:hypothetical protein